MKIDILGVQAFVALAEFGSFGKAAESLFITQTALSRRLQNLEAFLGVSLVERTTRSCALSTLGANFLPQARRLLAELQSSLIEIRESGNALRGDVTMACVPTIGVQYLPRVIQSYSAAHPENRIRVLDHASTGVEQAVLRREAEFGIGIDGQHDSRLSSRVLLHDRFVLICRDDHPLAARRRIRWMAIREMPLVLPGAGSTNRPLLDAGLAGSALQLRSQYEVQRSSTAVGLIAAGAGIAVVPSLSIQAGAYPSLRVIALTDPVITRGFVLLQRRGGSLSPAAQALVDLIVRDASGVAQARYRAGARRPGDRAGSAPPDRRYRHR